MSRQSCADRCTISAHVTGFMVISLSSALSGNRLANLKKSFLSENTKNFTGCGSAWQERRVGDAEVGGSNPPILTNGGQWPFDGSLSQMSLPKNVPYLNVWDRMDTWEPHEPDVTPEQLATYRQSLYGKILGMDVWSVDGFAIRGTKDVDFVAGGNPARYRYVPNGELWIESSMSPPDVLCTVVHEGVETILMSKGMLYESAHDLSNVFEWSLRQELMLERMRKPSTHQEAVSMANEWLREKLETVKRTFLPRMAFPDSEIASLNNQLDAMGYAFTSRVDAEQGKWKPGQTVDSPLGSIRIVAVGTVEDLARHPFFSDLTDQQKAVLSRYEKIDIVKFARA